MTSDRTSASGLEITRTNTVSSDKTVVATFAASIEKFRNVYQLPMTNVVTRSMASSTTGTSQPQPPIVVHGESRKRGNDGDPIENSKGSSYKVAPARSAAKKHKASSKYAPPSKYAHLPPLQDVLEENLICVFVGTNPGVRTATAGHAYAHPSNLFWKLLHTSGCTDERLRPEQDKDLPRLYSMGNTNIVDRPSKDAAELSKEETSAGTANLEEKFSRYRPEAVCIVGKGIWEAIWRWRYNREIRKEEFHYGWQSDQERMGKTTDWPGARVFVATTTSGLSAGMKLPEKEAIWRPFGEWVRSRRGERKAMNVMSPA